MRALIARHGRQLKKMRAIVAPALGGTECHRFKNQVRGN
jgi:hypothetical protein